MQIYHGKIIALDKNNRIYSYLGEEQGIITYLGNTMPPEYVKSDTIIELGEKALIPAFGDGHLHFSNWALFAVSYFDVRAAKSIQEIQNIVRDFMDQHQKLKTIIAFGVSKHRVKEKRLISRLELDEICLDIPLIIVCYDGHSAVCNTKMMNRFPEKIKNQNGYQAEKGHLFNEAYFAGTDFASSMVPPVKLIKSIIKSYDLLAEKGIGLIHTTEGIGFPKDLDVTLVSMLAKARSKKSQFQTRLFFQTMDVEKALKRKLPRIGGCFAAALDGCFGACDAALQEPYSNDPNNSGILFQTEEEVFEFAKTANRAGMQIEMHAIGDAAVSRAVKAIELALKDYPRKDHRHTIIHVCLISPNDLKKMAELEIGITLQPAFLISPLEPAAYLEEILGPRVKDSSPLQAIIDAGIHLSGGSDAPVTHPDPIESIYGACNHPYNAKQSVSIIDALKMHTYEVARTTFDEQERGSLEIGKVADMVVLNQDPLILDKKDLRSLTVEKLFLNGKAYKSGMGIMNTLWNGLVGRKEKI
jgi:predicted amidohydrolase YtcJ